MKNLKNFGITLAVSLAVLGIAALFACGFVADAVTGIFDNRNKNLDDILNSNDSSVTTSEEGDDRFSRELNGASFTWLWVVSDYRPEQIDNYFPDASAVKNMSEDEFGILGESYSFKEAVSIIVIRADVKKREYVVMNIPPQSKVSTPSGDMTLGMVYAVYGMDYFNGKITAMTGLKTDYYSVLNSTDLASLANAAGSINCKIPCDIYYDGKGNYVSDPEKGKKVETTSEKDKDKETEETTEDESTKDYEKELDKSEGSKLAAKLSAALLYKDLSDGLDDENTIALSFADGLMQNLSDASEGSMRSMLSALKSKFEHTNLDENAISANAEVIRAYTWFNVQTKTYPGKFVSAKGTSGAYYNPNIDEAVSFFYDYR